LILIRIIHQLLIFLYFQKFCYVIGKQSISLNIVYSFQNERQSPDEPRRHKHPQGPRLFPARSTFPIIQL